MNEYLTLPISDDTQMRAYVARPTGKPKAGILVFQEAFGVNAHIRDIADRFAKEGYLAIAPELYHRTAGDGFETDYVVKTGAMENAQAMTLEGTEADVRASYEWLANELKNDKIVSIGFCMGGRVSYVANSILPLKAVISFYGGGIAPTYLDRAPQLSGPMLFFWGGKDTHIPREQWSQVCVAIETAGKEHTTVEMGPAGHGFFCDAREAYHPESAALAWPLVLNFLSQKLGLPTEGPS